MVLLFSGCSPGHYPELDRGAARKTEDTLLRRRQVPRPPQLSIERHPVSVKKTLGGVWESLSTFADPSRATSRALKTAMALGRIMPNLGSPSTSKRGILWVVSTGLCWLRLLLC